MEQKIFKAYDVRGKYPKEINKEIVSEIIRSLSRYFRSKIRPKTAKIKLVVGRDARLSSPILYQTTVKQLKNQKIKTIESELITTPMLYFLVNYFKADAGIIITASHNPKEYNGLKVVGKRAIPISGKEILKIIQNQNNN